MTDNYRRAARRLVFGLRQNELLRRDVCESEECISRVVTELCCGRQLTDGSAQNSESTPRESVDCS